MFVEKQNKTKQKATNIRGGIEYWVKPTPYQTFCEKSQDKLSAAKYNFFIHLFEGLLC